MNWISQRSGAVLTLVATLVSCLNSDHLLFFHRTLLSWIGAATIAALLVVAVDLALVAGLRWQRVIVLLAVWSAGLAASEAQACDAVSERKRSAMNQRRRLVL